MVLVVGSDLDAMNTQGFRQPRPPRLIALDLARPVTYPPDVWVEADAADALRGLLTALPGEPRAAWWARPAGRSAHAGPEVDFLAAFESGLPPDAVVVADMCIPGYWYAAFGTVAAARGLAYPVGWGTLGFGFPRRSGLRCPAGPRWRWSGTAGSSTPAASSPPLPRNGSR
ncbi:hypothetical protein [Blastococcus brunescens]|uniref:Uncharacterized protein n=1 Tax=Blastococcus brunescens TaxID=1564165 RepID=A0ABZ1B039_9ACTN|nr:hypothetical protein [Blastococcus sp. BMG 8361]WRL64177.1 hypothetical protein U6N30_32260 [Blastococcus sp. BMG 8361]